MSPEGELPSPVPPAAAPGRSASSSGDAPAEDSLSSWYEAAPAEEPAPQWYAPPAEDLGHEPQHAAAEAVVETSWEPEPDVEAPPPAPRKAAPRKAAKKAAPKKATPAKAAKATKRANPVKTAEAVPTKRAPRKATPRTVAPRPVETTEVTTTAPPETEAWTTAEGDYPAGLQELLVADPAAPVTVVPARRRSRAVGFVLVVVVLMLAGAAALGAAAYNERKVSTYTSKAVVLVDQPFVIAASRDQGIVLKLSALRVRYASQIASTNFAQQVADRAALPIGVVRQELSAQLPSLGLQLVLLAKGGDPETTRRVASAAAQVLIENNEAQQAAIHVKPELVVKLSVVTPAERGKLLEPDHKRSAELGAGAAVAVLLAAGLIRSATRRRDDT
jgi:hypothetical protein